jgi:hypothetical protein
MFGAAERRFVGPLMIRGLKAIGPEIQPIEDTRYEYRVHRAVVTISDGKVRITGRITERGQLKVRGRFSGEGVLEGETAYLLYVVQDDARRAVFRGAAYFRIPRAGASLAGYWMTDDALQTERKAIAVGDVRMGPGSSIG